MIDKFAAQQDIVTTDRTDENARGEIKHERSTVGSAAREDEAIVYELSDDEDLITSVISDNDDDDSDSDGNNDEGDGDCEVNDDKDLSPTNDVESGDEEETLTISDECSISSESSEDSMDDVAGLQECLLFHWYCTRVTDKYLDGCIIPFIVGNCF